MAWFEFAQNNSGGYFAIDDAEGIGPRVWIEAANACEANARAVGIGIYFDGEGDCPCCGDRWCATWEKTVGVAAPTVFPEYDFGWHDTVYAHATDGSIHRLRQDDLKAASIPVDIRHDH